MSDTSDPAAPGGPSLPKGVLLITVEDELKQKELVAPLSEVYSAQNAVQTTLTALIEAYKAECDRMQG